LANNLVADIKLNNFQKLFYWFLPQTFTSGLTISYLLLWR